MATSEDVARTVGVSRSTVSRALNGSSLISAEMRERIRRAAADLGYQPDVVAQSLARQQSRSIAVGVFPEREGSVFHRLDQSDFLFYLHVLESIESEAVARGYDLLLPSHPYNSPAEYVRSLRTRHVAGAIMLALPIADPRIQAMVDADIPAVFVDVLAQGRRATAVKADNLTGMRQAAEHIINLGHRDIAILAGNPTSLSGVERLAACQRAFAQAGIDFDTSIVRQAGFQLERAYTTVLALLDERRTFTAIMALSDAMAIGALRALHERGVRVPDDVSVTGFDDLVFSSYTTPALTTVAQDGEAIGRGAVRLLIELIGDNTQQPQPLIVPTRFVLRQSTGPARR